MRLILFLPIFLGFLFTTKTVVSRSSQLNVVCNSFLTGEIDAYKTLDALGLNIDDYSIGVNNTAKIFCF